MKTITKLLLASTLLVSSTTFAQMTTESESAMNAKLRDNSIKAQEQQDKLNVDRPQNTINHLSAEKNLQLNPSNNLTDQDKQLSENFVHQGKANRIMKENCAGEMSSVCMGSEGKHKFMGMDPAMMKAVAQAYALFGTMGGDSFLSLSKGKAKDAKEADASGPGETKAAEGAKSAEGTKTTDTAKDGKEAEKANDYCKYIPSVTEGIATFTQMNMTKDLAEIGNGETAQKDSLLKAAKSHDGRAKMAQMQATGWFGGAACYAASASFGSFAWDKNLLIKMGAATLLGAFYQSEVAANKEYADKTRKIAAQLPGKGDCNPITDRLCYCSQPETENDPQYCLKNLHKKAIAKDSYRIACTDDKMQIDPNCNCEAKNACFDKLLEAQGQGALELGLAYSGSPFKSIRSFARGELEGGTLSSKSFDRTAAIARRALNELGAKLPPTGPLTPAQKVMADAFLKRGIPASVAAAMAQNPPSQSAINSAMAKLEGSSGLVVMATPANKNSHVLDFSGGAGLGISGNLTKRGDAEDLAAKLKLGTSKASPNSKILEFAQRAQEQAGRSGQIRKEDDRPLFEIISLRYQLSGRKLLQVEGE